MLITIILLAVAFVACSVALYDVNGWRIAALVVLGATLLYVYLRSGVILTLSNRVESDWVPRLGFAITSVLAVVGFVADRIEKKRLEKTAQGKRTA